MPPSTRTTEKVLRFLQERKRPVSANTIADHFLISIGLARRALHYLHACGQAQCRTSPLPTGGRLSLWTAFPHYPPMDEQDEPAQPSQSSRNTASYPHIRGYDD